MPVQRYIAELREGKVYLERVDAEILPREHGVMGLSIAGSGEPEDLAREAAVSHFERHPERKKVFITASSRSVDWTWNDDP